jgi:cytochrome c-type biogenesis protein CcmH
MAPSVAGRRITGTVRLEEGLEPIPNAVLFVIARSSEGGPPLAVRRLVPRTFPVEFELGPEDAMIPGRPFDGPLRLSARLDADGDPMTRGPRDLAVEAGPVVSGSASGVELILRRGS